MAKLSTDELLDAFKEMTLLELSEFVKQFEGLRGHRCGSGRRRRRPRRRWRCRRGRRGAVGVRRHPRGCRRQEDRRHQGRPRDRLRPGPEGSQGSGRRRSQAAAGEGLQGGRRGRQGQARGRRRQRHRQVVHTWTARTPESLRIRGFFACMGTIGSFRARVLPNIGRRAWV
jgi:hypothetical protein